MKKFIPIAYAEYGREIDKGRAIPFYRDALKPVERRLLISLNNKAKKKFVVSSQVVGDCMGNYHHHGDQSIYGSLVQLVREKSFATGQGNWGKIGINDGTPAAFRYTQVKANTDLINFCFELVKFVPWEDVELLGVDQPLYLPSPIPIGLIGESVIQGIAFHYTKVPMYSLTDLINRLINLLKIEANIENQYQTIIPKIKNCDVYELNPGDFEKILQTGTGSIYIVPNMEIDHRGVHVYGKSPLGTSSWWKYHNEHYNLIDLSSTYLHALFEPINNQNVDQNFINGVFETVKSNIHFKCNFVNDNELVETYSIDQILLAAYNNWVNLLKNSYIAQLHQFQDRRQEYKTILAIRQILHDNPGAKKVNDIVNLFTSNYQQKFPDVDANEIQHTASKHSIKRLIEINIDLAGLEQEIRECQKSIDNIDTIAFNRLTAYLDVNKEKINGKQ